MVPKLANNTIKPSIPHVAVGGRRSRERVVKASVVRVLRLCLPWQILLVDDKSWGFRDDLGDIFIMTEP